MTQTKDKIPLFVMGLMALFFALLIAMVYANAASNARFEKDGIETTAVFVSGRTQRTNNQPDKPVRFRHFATVRFEAGRDLMTVEAQVSSDYLRKHEPGARVSIRYLPDNPQKVLIDPLFASRQTGLAWMFLIFFAGCLIVPVVMRWRKRRRGEVAAPKPRPRTKAGPLPRWVRVISVVLMICALGSFFTLSVWLRYAVEAATLPHIGWVSLPLAMASMLVPPVGFGLANLALIWFAQRYRRVAG
ncbi:DUF3592 domain-containing protein [Antarctobacter jejuensis]|uniref:DUF3592 domain-containing protein n=1 Tax=Antarctobacter jejuensis TaxID=1439938 RepID=UPI003FD5EE67